MATATIANRVPTKAGRFYDIDGKLYPSVTTILGVIGKPQLINWAAKVEREMVLKVSADLYEDAGHGMKMGRSNWLIMMEQRIGREKAHSKELAKAGEIGSQVHALIEWTLKASMMYEAGPSPRISDKAQWAFMAWQDWRKSVNLKPLLIEQVVYSTKHKYAGTLDLFALVNDVPTVIDWKTGKSVYGEAHLQNAAYRRALREMGHGDPKAGLIVRLPKVETDPEFEVIDAKSERAEFPRFLDAMRLWKWQQKEQKEYEARQAANRS